MNAAIANPAYTSLLAKVPPKIIRSEAENEYYIEPLYALEQKRSLSREEKEFSDLLALLIEDFEERQYQLPRATPRQALSFLMEQHGLKQKDLTDIFGTRSVVSEVMKENGNSRRSKSGQRFQVSPEIFF